MPRLRRLLAALLGMLLLQLTLHESLWALAAPADGHHASAMQSVRGPTHDCGDAAEAAVARSARSGESDGATAASATASPTTSLSATPTRDGGARRDCCVPGAMSSGCAACATLATLAAAAPDVVHPTPGARWPVDAATLASVAASPDVPPPKR